MCLNGAYISTETQRSFKSNVLVGLAGGVAGRLVTLVSLTICAKFFYTQEDIGYWGTLFSIAMFIAPLAIWRYELAIVLPDTKEKARLIALGAIILITVATLLVSIVIMLDIPRKLFPDFVALDIVVLLPLLLFQQNVRKVAEYWLIRLKKFYVVAALDLTQSLLVAFFAIGLGYFYSGNVVIFSYANFIAIVLGSGVFVIVAIRNGLLSGTKRFGFRQGLRELVVYKAYPLYLTPYTLSNGLNQYAFIIMLTASYDASLSGAYVLAHRLVYAPVLLLVTPIRQVFYSYSSTHDGRLDAESKARQKRILSYLVWVVPPAALTGSLVIEQILSRFLGDGFKEAVDIAQILVFTASANILAGWMDRTYDLLGKQRVSVVMQLASDVTIFTIAVCLIYNGYESMFVIKTFAMLLLAYQFIWLFVTLRVTGWSGQEISKVFIAISITSMSFLLMYVVLVNIYHSDIVNLLVLCGFAALWVLAATGILYRNMKRPASLTNV